MLTSATTFAALNTIVNKNSSGTDFDSESTVKKRKTGKQSQILKKDSNIENLTLRSERKIIKTAKNVKMASVFGLRNQRLVCFGIFLCLGLYSAKIGAASSHEHGDSDFSVLKNVLVASEMTSDCEKEIEDVGANSSHRVRRGAPEKDEIDADDDAPGMPSCLDKTDPTYYVSKYHRAVCKATVELVYEIFFEREPTESEFTEWFNKCVDREVNEAYLLWTFAEDEEHIELLKEKKKRKLEGEIGHNDPTSGEADTGDEDDSEEPVQNAEQDPLAVPMQMRMPDEEFTDELNDPESEEFKKKSDEYGEALADVLADDVPGLTGVKVLGFENGSIIVYYELIFDDDVRTVAHLYEGEEEKEFIEAEFDPKTFAKNVKDKVKGVIKETLSNPEERKRRLNNTILADKNVDLESLDTIPDEVVEDLIQLNPNAPVVKVDLTTHHGSDTSHGSDPNRKNNEEAQTPDELIHDENDDSEEENTNNISDKVVTTTSATTKATATTTSNDVGRYTTTESSPGFESTTTQNLPTTTSDPNAYLDSPEYLDTLDDDGQYGHDNDDDAIENVNDVTTPIDTSDFNKFTTVASETGTVSTSVNGVINDDDIIDGVTHATNTSASSDPGPVDEGSGGTTETPELTESERIAAEGKENPLPGKDINDPNQTVFMKLRVTNMNYTQNLTDRQSEEFRVLEAKFVEILKPLLQSMDGFVDMEVVGFSYGSLVVNNELHFKEHVPENVKDEVKVRIEAAKGYFQYAHLAVDTEALEVLKSGEANLCEFVQCQLYSDCVVRNDFKTECVCRPGYISVDPRNCVSLCDLEPGYCRNGGKCHVVPGRGAVCRCQVHYNWAYSGERCENLMPKSVLLVSVSTGVACVTFMLLLAGSIYFFHRRRRNRKADQLAMEAEDRDFMRAAQIMSGDKRSSGPERHQRINPMFVHEDSPSSDFKEIHSNSSSNTSSISIGGKSGGSTSTSSFFVREQLGYNGPIPSEMDTPERRMLHLQVGKYPNHRQTWCEDDEHKKKKTKKDKQTRNSNNRR